jgi:beta-glucanase (GH16 family)
VTRNGKGGRLFRFGYFEARMKWDTDPKTWAAFWLFSHEHMMETDDKKWCEIDVIESMRPNTFSGHAHNWVNFKTTYNKNGDYPLGPDFKPTQWHNYGMLFEEDKITWFYDGKPLFSTETPPPCKEQQLFLVLTSQQHGIGPGAHPDPTQTYIQKSVYFDWVRAYIRP